MAPGELNTEDWNAIVTVLSRIPDDNVGLGREVMHIWTFDPYGSTVAVKIQLQTVIVVLVKKSPTEWIIAGLYGYAI